MALTKDELELLKGRISDLLAEAQQGRGNDMAVSEVMRLLQAPEEVLRAEAVVHRSRFLTNATASRDKLAKDLEAKDAQIERVLAVKVD